MVLWHFAVPKNRGMEENMRIKPTAIAAVMAMGLFLCGFSIQKAPEDVGQPLDERRAQDALPKSHDDIWTAFGKCKVSLDKKNYTYSIACTPEVKAMAGKKTTVSGFMLPLESDETFTHFLLSKRTPTCPFCPPGEPNEIVEVFSKKPVKWEDGIVAVTGTMHFTSNPEMGLFFQMKDADMMSSVASMPFEHKTLPNF